MIFFARQNSRGFKAGALWGLWIGASFFSQAAVAQESPITRIKADYVCQLQTGNEQVAFTLAAPKNPPRAWLGMTDNDMGLELTVSTFTFKACAGCYHLTGQYSFTGGLNLAHLETVEDVPGAQFQNGEWPPRRPVAPLQPEEGPIELPPAPPESESFFIPDRQARLIETADPQGELKTADCDLPPGMELPPECGGEDPGESPVEPNPPTDPVKPVQPAGPQLQVRYYETSADASRIIFQGTGICKAVFAESLTE
jgi:hypothetical protein